jgi:hypothetical protein
MTNLFIFPRFLSSLTTCLHVPLHLDEHVNTTI